MDSRELRALMREMRWDAKDLAVLTGASSRSAERWVSGAREVPEGVGFLIRACRNIRGYTSYEEMAGFMRQQAARFEELAAIQRVKTKAERGVRDQSGCEDEDRSGSHALAEG